MEGNIQERLALLPSAPGVYLMKDAHGRLLYVGKARDLKKRVSSYFRETKPKNMKTAVLVGKVSHFETIITRSEKEALILEANLIKRHRPRYNVILRDDKQYPCLRLDINETYPSLSIVRKFKKDGALYFGPFASALAVRETLKFIHKTFKIRRCKTKKLKPRPRPCLNHQMGLCLGPCSLPVDPGIYDAVIKEVILFLKGRTPALIETIRTQMEKAAAVQDFETAANLRDKMFALQQTLEKQAVATPDFKDRDVLGVAREGGEAVVTILFIRGGILLGSRNFFISQTTFSEEEVISSFLQQYYPDAPLIPEEILLPLLPSDLSALEDWLAEHRGNKVKIKVPKRGEKVRLLRMAKQNAENALRERQESALKETSLLDRLQRVLKLSQYPRRIECFDLSCLGGDEAVGGMVVFEDGKALPSAYRRFRVRSIDHPDDYAMLAEVLMRRFGRKGDSFPVPSLLMVDGGRGQVNTAMRVLRELGIEDELDVVGIAKKDPKLGETEDKIYKSGRVNPLILEKEPDVLLFLQKIRDEAHRFVITYHRKRRRMAMGVSILDTIPGVGKRRKEALLKYFGSLKRIKEAQFEELCQVPGMNRKVATEIIKRFSEASIEV